MKKTILIASLSHRGTSAAKFQKILTAFGCIIKTRIGIHDGVLNQCSDRGLIILELVGDARQARECARRLKALNDVRLKTVTI